MENFWIVARQVWILFALIGVGLVGGTTLASLLTMPAVISFAMAVLG